MSSDCSDSNLKDIAEGITKGTLDWTGKKGKDFVKFLAKKFFDKDLSFIESQETLELVKKQKTKAEWNLFKKYMDERDLRVLFQMGLTLRELEKNKKSLEPLQATIFKKFQEKGLHIAYFVQNGLFSEFIGNILKKGGTDENIKAEVKLLFYDIDKYVAFINRDDDVEIKARQIVTKIDAHNPSTFIISSAGLAIEKCEEIKKLVIGRISSDYSSEYYGSELEQRRIYFFNKINKFPSVKRDIFIRENSLKLPI